MDVAALQSAVLAAAAQAFCANDDGMTLSRTSDEDYEGRVRVLVQLDGRYLLEILDDRARPHFSDEWLRGTLADRDQRIQWVFSMPKDEPVIQVTNWPPGCGTPLPEPVSAMFDQACRQLGLKLQLNCS